MKKIFYSLLFIVMALPYGNAQKVIINGEIRPRVEYRDGYSKPILSTDDPGVFASQRTRLGFTFKRSIMTTQITLQDARVFGEYANATTEATTGIYEAWAEIHLIPGGSLKIGRQTVKYDDNRLFAAPNWSIKGRAHDMLLFKYNVDEFKFNLGLAYNNNSAISTETYYTPVDKYRSMAYLWFSTPTYKGFTITGLFVDEGVQDTLGVGTTYKNFKLNQAFTFGGNLKFAKKELPFSAYATAYFQAGENSVGKTKDGKLLAIKANYAFTSNLSASLGTDFLSGDKNGTADGIQSNFNKLYGSNHAFNGYMDYWSTPLTQGLLDYYARVNYIADKKLKLEGDYHIFNSEFDGTSKQGVAFEKDLGSELDLVVSYKLSNWTTVQGGYCTYFKTANTLIAKDIATSSTMPDVHTPQFAYVMLTVRPTFLDTGE